MSAQEMIALTREHSMFSWVAQNVADPIAIERAEGIHFWSIDGKRYLDHNSPMLKIAGPRGRTGATRDEAGSKEAHHDPSGRHGYPWEVGPAVRTDK